MTTARERVTSFCDNWNKPHGNMHPDIIYGIWRTVDGKDQFFELTISDIREVLSNSDRVVG